MPAEVESLYNDLVKCAMRFGISVAQADLDDEVPGEFDGPTITLNHDYDPVERAFYLAHSIGSIAEWSLQFDRSYKVMHELQNAKRGRTRGAGELECACRVLVVREQDLGVRRLVVGEFRAQSLPCGISPTSAADMEAMRLFHTTGKAPVWRVLCSLECGSA